MTEKWFEVDGAPVSAEAVMDALKLPGVQVIFRYAEHQLWLAQSAMADPGMTTDQCHFFRGNMTAWNRAANLALETYMELQKQQNKRDEK